MTPDAAVRDELAAALGIDSTQLGNAYRALDIDPNAIVSPYHRIIIATILNGEVPTAVTYRARAAVRIKAMLLAVPKFTPATEVYLDELLTLLEDYTVEGTIDPPKPPPREPIPSIYVYSLPAYIRNPASPDGRTWLKVGRTNSKPSSRVAAQGKRTTGLPEDPVLLRVYQGTRKTDIGKVERAIHGALVALGHDRQTGSQAGREWFLTDLAALDALTTIIGLKPTTTP